MPIIWPIYTAPWKLFLSPKAISHVYDGFATTGMDTRQALSVMLGAEKFTWACTVNAYFKATMLRITPTRLRNG